MALFALLGQIAVPLVHEAQIGADPRRAFATARVCVPVADTPQRIAEHHGPATEHDADACPVCRALVHLGGLSPASHAEVLPPPVCRRVLAESWRPARAASRTCGNPRAPPAFA